MAGVVNTIVNLLLGLLLGFVVTLPVIWLWWRHKGKKIRKKIPKNMLEKIKEAKEDERRLENERQRRRDAKNSRRKSAAAIANLKLRRTEELRKQRDIQTKSNNKLRKDKPDTKVNWPKFE